MSRRRDRGRVREGYMRQIDWPDGYVDDYEPASREHNLAQARGMIARLYGRQLELIKRAPPGICEDCAANAVAGLANGHLRVVERVRYGRFDVCRGCGLMRRNAKAPAA